MLTNKEEKRLIETSMHVKYLLALDFLLSFALIGFFYAFAVDLAVSPLTWIKWHSPHGIMTSLFFPLILLPVPPTARFIVESLGIFVSVIAVLFNGIVTVFFVSTFSKCRADVSTLDDLEWKFCMESFLSLTVLMCISLALSLQSLLSIGVFAASWEDRTDRRKKIQ